MSILAEQLDERLQQLDPQTAAHVEQLVREVLALTELPSAKSPVVRGRTLLELSKIGEPMGTMTNEEIDRAVYGE